MSGSSQDWLDEHTAERLLRGERADSSRADASEPLAALLAAAAAGGRLDPAGEEAALAAYRAARSDTAVPITDAAAHSRLPGASGDSELSFGSGGRHRVRMDRLRGLPGSAKVAVAAAFATTALVGGVAAAGTGVIPYPFTTTGSDSGPVPSRGKPAPSTDDTAAPRDLQVTGSPSHFPSPSVFPSESDSSDSSGRAGAGASAPAAHTRPEWPECRNHTSPDHKKGAPQADVPSADVPWAPVKHPHAALPGLSDQLAYFALDGFSDMGKTTAKTAEMPTQPQPQPQPSQPQPQPQPQPSQTTGWPPFPSRPQDARYAQPQRTGQARHAKRPKHAKPSAWRAPCRLRTGGKSGCWGL